MLGKYERRFKKMINMKKTIQIYADFLVFRDVLY